MAGREAIAVQVSSGAEQSAHAFEFLDILMLERHLANYEWPMIQSPTEK
jgi:hypothetical protein